MAAQEYGYGDSAGESVERPPTLCPLDTRGLVDVIMQFVLLYNEPAGIVLYAYQQVFMRRIIKSLLDKEGAIITGLWSRQSGKSEALSSLASALCIFMPVLCKAFPDDPRLGQYLEGFWIGIFAPKQQQSGIIYDRIRRRAERESSMEIYADPEINVTLTQSRGDQVSWSNGSFVIAQTASEQSNVEGKTFHLVIIDEAQLVGRAKVWKEIHPMLAATNGTMCQIGTANALRGGFKEMIVQNVEAERKGSARNHFEFPYDQVILEKRKTYEECKRLGKPNADFHLNYEKFVEGALRAVGGNKDNAEFRQNFRLMWAEIHSGAIDPVMFEDCADTTMDWGQPCYGLRCVAGLDYGKKKDVTVLTIYAIDDKPIVDPRALVRHGEDQQVYYKKKIIGVYEIEGRQWYQILQKVVDHVQYFAVDTIVCDGTGIGDPLTEQLQALLPGVQVVPFNMSYVGNDKVFKLYIQELEAGRIEFCAGEATQQTLEYQEFRHEHEILIRDKVGAFIKCYAPDGEHDDYCDSSALGCYACTIDPGMAADLECTENPFYGSPGAHAQAIGTRTRSDRYRHRN